MDLVDIDKELKDDSFIGFEEKYYDDVANIIQQWKSSNGINPNNVNIHHQLPPSLQLQHKYQQQNEEAYKLNSRTFTRPKRKLVAQNLNFNNVGEFQDQDQPINTTPMINVQIGGKVRTPLSARSMLQDTSPPSSICSMETSLDNFHMNNSLITSADFTNISFVLSTNSLESDINRDKINADEYTLNDMIRDRKALESLTLSGDDGTLIKDSQIAQIDDISLALYKAGSGSSTMDNSTESFENSGGNATMVLNKKSSCNGSGFNATFISDPSTTTAGDNSENTFTVSENDQSFIISRRSKSHETDTAVHPTVLNNVTFDKSAMPKEDAVAEKLKTVALNETICITEGTTPERGSIGGIGKDKTFDCQDEILHTPESSMAPFTQIFESTPLIPSNAGGYGSNRYSFAPSRSVQSCMQIVEDGNLSPVTPEIKLKTALMQQINETKSPKPNYPSSPLSRFENIDYLENTENPHETYNRRRRRQQQELQLQQQQQQQMELASQAQARLDKSAIEMQNVMDLAEAEAELLAAADDGVNDEEHFEHMLDELGRIKLNADQLKMKKSLETIKKRFNCSMNNNELSSHTTTTTASMSSGENYAAQSKTFTSETREEALRKLRDSLRSDDTNENASKSNNSAGIGVGGNSSSHTSKEVSNGSISSGSGLGSSFTVSTSLINSGSSSGERLLSRRSRLYDDLNITASQGTSKGSGGEVGNATRLNETMTIIAPVVQKQVEATNDNAAVTDANDYNADENRRNLILMNEKTETGNGAVMHKLPEKRERDRDRFKTMKIIKNANGENGSATGIELNVPCIDNDEDGGNGNNRDDNKYFNKLNETVNIATDNKKDFTNTLEELSDGDVSANDRAEISASRLSRRDLGANKQIATEAEEESKMHPPKTHTNFLTYKKPKDSRTLKNLTRPDLMSNGDIDDDIEMTSTATAATNPHNEVNSLTSKTEIRSLSRPRYISGLQKFSVVSKAISAGDLKHSDDQNTAAMGEANTINAEGKMAPSFGFRKANIAANKSNTKSSALNVPTAAATKTKELKSPMGMKAKSLHNLTYTTTAAGVVAPSRIGSFGLRKINSAGLSVEQQQTKLMPRTQKAQTSLSAASIPKEAHNGVFKRPQQSTGVQRNSEAGVSTATSKANMGLARPSSGYYSLNVMAKGGVVPATSNSNTIKPSRSTTSINAIENTTADTKDTQAMKLPTTGTSTGIPKPSGLRPPTKRSGLARPTSMVKR